MSDGSQVFVALKKSLTKLFPKMEGHQASHFSTLLHMITGMVVSKHCHLPKVAGKVKSDTKQESQIKKFKRWLSNKSVNGNLFYLPFLERLLPILMDDSIKLILDGSVVGKDSACLMASIIYKNSSIPIVWLMAEGRKGHFSKEYHIELLEMLKSIFPDNIEIIVIGDGEFDRVEFLETIEEYGWYFVVRTANNSKFSRQGYAIQLPKRLKSGECRSWSDIQFTDELYGPLQLSVWKSDKGCEMIYLVSNCRSSLKVRQWYKKRQRIETFFSDLKTKGFYVHKSHISDLGRLGNLMLAACLGYIWVVLLGEYALYKGINTIFHRTDRCDLSFLQLGFRHIEYLLNNNMALPTIDFGVMG